MGKYKIEILKENFPCEEITELLHISYKKHIDKNRQFLAATQTVEQTRKRLENGICMLAYEGDKLVGTISCKIYNRKGDETRKWYEDDSYAMIGQMAVHPEHQKSNLIAVMLVKGLRREEICDLDSVITDTSVEATDLVRHYTKIGFQRVDMVSWATTNYYSYMFRMPLKGKKYSDKYCNRKFFWASLKCKLQYRADGKKRFF